MFWRETSLLAPVFTASTGKQVAGAGVGWGGARYKIDLVDCLSSKDYQSLNIS